MRSSLSYPIIDDRKREYNCGDGNLPILWLGMLTLIANITSCTSNQKVNAYVEKQKALSMCRDYAYEFDDFSFICP